jgi:hypothetical protein
MRRWLIILLALPLFTTLLAQNRKLTQYEYWLDKNYEARISRNLSGSEEQINVQIDTREMDEGMHTISIRTGDDTGAWSGIFHSSFLVFRPEVSEGTQLTSCEYWIDENFEQRQEIAATGEDVAFSIDTNNLANGRHTISLRAKNNLGVYSGILHNSFFKFEVEERGGTPVLCEYWFDGDFASKQEVPVTNGSVAFYAETQGQTEGMHSLSWRIKDDKGIYSSIHSSHYYKYVPSISAEDIAWYQYWWNDRSDLAVRKEVTTSGELALQDIFEVPDYVAESNDLERGTAEFHILFCNDKGILSGITTEVVEDRIPPVSHMDPLPPSQETNMQMLSWSGSDKWAGVKDYTVYVYENTKKEWIPFIEHTTETSAPFYCASSDEVMKFFVIARDSLDNEEPMKTEAETQIRFMYTDIYPPTTTLSVSSETANAGEAIQLTWETIDDVNEIEVNNVYFSEDGGPLILWKSVTGTNSVTFKGKGGSTYQFIVTGRDAMGNSEKPEMENAVTVRFNR